MGHLLRRKITTFVDISNLVPLIKSIDASRVKRQNLADIIIHKPSLMEPLMRIAFSEEGELAIKACWIVEFVAKSDLNLLLAHLNFFTENLSGLKEDSSIRPMAKLCEILILSYFKKKQDKTLAIVTDKHLEQIATACFDWLIGDYKVASKAYSMTSLYYLGSKIKWIRPELKLVLEQDYSEGSAAYKARAREILTLLQ